MSIFTSALLYVKFDNVCSVKNIVSDFDLLQAETG